MAKKALLIWCAGSALVCGSAALATTSLWQAAGNPESASRADAAAPLPGPAETTVASLPAANEPAATPGTASEQFVSLETVSFFSPRAAGASSFFRGTLDPSAAAAPAADLDTNDGASIQAPIVQASAAPTELPAEQDSSSGTVIGPEQPVPGFAEVAPDDSKADHRLAVLPPPRPSLQLARLDTNPKTATDMPGADAAPGFATPVPAPQTSPGWNWSDAFNPQAATRPSGPERLFNSGIASWYGPGFHGRKTANGERFDQNAMTAAHRTLPFGTRVKVVDEKSGRSIIVRINDRGPYAHGRVIDLSKAAAQALGVNGLAKVRVVSAN